jgi:hypothetical protein
MPERARFHILTPDGMLSQDTFVLAERQPQRILEGCVLVLDEATHRQMTVHRTRLVPTSDSTVTPMSHKHSACPKCGKVAGVLLDNVPCPNHYGVHCGLVHANE